nr:peptidyl-prolyl cis-trans isomerase G-like isoform X2 [Crassostrea virginica]
MKKSTKKKFDLMKYFKAHMATDSHMQNAPKKPSPNKNDSSQQESSWNKKDLLQNVDNSSKSYFHGVERSRESSSSVEHLHETPPKRSEKRSREESRGKSSERSRNEKRCKQGRHSHSKSREREKSRTPHSPESVQYSNESPPKMSKEKSREDSRGKSREMSPKRNRKKHSHSKSPKKERSRSRHSPRSGEKRRRSRSSSGSSRGSTHEIRNQKVPAKSPRESISPTLFDTSSNSSTDEDEDFKSEKTYKEDGINQKVLAKSRKKSISPIIFENKSFNSSKGEHEDFKSRKLYKEDSLKLIKQDKRMDKKEHFCFFFGKDSPFSNFHSAAFEVQGIRYRCSEQFMMHQKAVLFEDNNHADLIMRATDPREMKKLGRKVENFNPNVWGMKSERIVRVGIKAKFEQNERLKKALIATFPRILVEAAPRDRLWGIGMGSSNIKAYSRLTWRGQNKLGYLLTYIRNEIMEKEGLFSELSGV